MIFHLNQSKLVDEKTLHDMSRSLKHRGPDDLGTYCSDEGDGQLGQVRLSIIDLTSAGHQPMVDSSGRFIIVYNGEIYNFKILKKNLEINRLAHIAYKANAGIKILEAK